MKTSDYVKSILDELPDIQDEQAERLVSSIFTARKVLCLRGWQVWFDGKIICHETHAYCQGVCDR
ncbi:hypothetical protein ACEQPO_19885 [Bacillus sp. SL00103]